MVGDVVKGGVVMDGEWLDGERESLGLERELWGGEVEPKDHNN